MAEGVSVKLPDGDGVAVAVADWVGGTDGVLVGVALVLTDALAVPLSEGLLDGVPLALPRTSDCVPALVTNWMPVKSEPLLSTLMPVTYSPAGTLKFPR